MKKFGFTLILLGLAALLAYLLEPLRNAWASFREWDTLPQLALGLGVVGLLFLLASLIVERWQERGQDRALRDE